MKKNQFALLAATFISGIILGISALGLYSFTNVVPSPLPLPSNSKISVQEANTLFKNYYNRTAPDNSVFKGFAINKDQLAAINVLLSENQSLSGFRVYMGYDNNVGNVDIIVGVNASGLDVTGSIYRSAAAGSGPCPTICDGNSAITAK